MSLPRLTTAQRLGPGEVLRRGRRTSYREVTRVGGGEAHVVRRELIGPARGGEPSAGGRALLALVHATDLQLADVQSPGRFEFFNRELGDPRFAHLIPVQRPQEVLTAHAVDATLRTVNALAGAPATGAPLQLVVTTGDAIDNAQWNEVQAFLALFDGGLVRTDSGGPAYEGVQARCWPDDIFWRPDGDGPGGPDVFRRDYGFPHLPGLLERGLADFRADGLRLPWLACYGNHEALDQGVGVFTPALSASLVGDRKPLQLLEGVDRDTAVELFVRRAEAFLVGPSRTVTADPGRRAVSRAEFVAAHFREGSRPYGHGFGERNRRDGTAYYVHDLPGVRLVGLDTTCLAGMSTGWLDPVQARWLEESLAEVSSSYRGRDGGTVRTGARDSLVVLFSHHGVDTLSNTRAAPTGPDSEPLLSAVDVLALLHRFPNVVLWLNGHTHRNTVTARPDPLDPARGFWEVTTCAVMDWPCQTRVVELVDRGDGALTVVCTMLDHDSPTGPASLEASPPRTRAELAALHRELAANVPWAGFDAPLAGAAADRNVELRLPAPFPLRRLPGL